MLDALKICFKQAKDINVEERDATLGLDGETWPLSRLPGWIREESLLRRSVVSGEKPEEELAVPLKERILRFPSAPIHGLHRLSQEHVNMGPVESFHSYRLLSHRTSRKPVSRIFLLHNGLNETGRMGLYYQLASHLIEQDRGTVCLLRPFPGHLTRCASAGLTETPLDHYLWDGLHLFRQFLRYMIETRWLLSAIVRYSAYHCASGSGLLGESTDVETSRLSSKRLAKEMAREWRGICTASRRAVKGQRHKSPKMPRTPSDVAFEQAIASLRETLGLDRLPEMDGSFFDPDVEPEIHAIGYSLGGFAAQSVFMSWAFLVSSCSTLFSGGAMRELAPTAFADPEEWQTVLHSLRYELDDAMMDWRLNRDSRRVAGIGHYLFLYLKRTFYEVFQQEYRGSFQTRAAAFRQRMLFVVGGDDPIVRPRSVLDAGPPDGINMLAVGGMGHFLGDRPQDEVESEQRKFWVPEIARVIGSLAETAAEKHRADLVDTWLGEDDLLPGPDGEEEDPHEEDHARPEMLSIEERLEVERDGTLPNRLFQRSLDDLLARAAAQPGNGLLFILKNDAPTFLLDERGLQQHAAALYHEDVSIVDYIRAVRSRRPILRDLRDRICVVLPWNLETIVKDIDAGLQHPSQSEGSGEQMASAPDSETTWRNLYAKCETWSADEHLDAVRVFDGRNPTDEESPLATTARARLGLEGSEHGVTSALPDCWVWMSNEFFGRMRHSSLSIKSGLASIAEVVQPYVEKTAKSEREIATEMQQDHLRMLSLSRARYNPRFRGRVIAKPRQAQELLLRVALCIDASVPFRTFRFPDRNA